MSALRRRPNRRLLTTSAFGALALAAVWAAPAHAQLVQGAVPAQSNGAGPTIDQSVPNTTTVTLGGSRTVIDWDKFDVNSGDTANFVFANRSDIVLNRVSGAGSTINGNLNGTIGSAGGATGGNIWIYNANGVVIGANARVSTGGLLVTTAAIDRATDSSAGGFLDGTSTQFGFTGAGTGNITVQNGAQIASHGGAIALVAPVVTAEAGSSISAQDGGNVLVGSAAKYQISFRPTSTDDMDLLSFEVADGAGTSGTDAINLAGDIGGNRVFVAAVSKSGLVASIMSTGAISATTAATDETGAIVLSANHDIVNGAAAAAPLSGIGEGYVSTFGGAVTGPKVDFVASENVLLRGDVGEAGAIVNLRSDNTDVKQYAGVITADTLTASAHTGINFNSFSANRVDKLGALSTDTGDLAYIGDEDGVILTGAISAPGKVTLGARGFMDTTTGSISAGSLELSLGGGGSFKVNGDANLRYGQSQGAVTIQATGGITLSNEFQMLLGDTLTLTADAGAIRETGGFISGGGAVVANAAGEIDLSGANSFTSLTANSTNGENITVNATGNLDFKVNTFSVARFTVGGDATSSGTNALISGGLFVTAGGAINLNSDGGYTEFGDLSAGGNITLAMDGNLVLGGVLQTGGALSLTSRGGAIRQTSGTISLGTGYTLNAATGIDLNQTGNHLGNAGSNVSDVTSGNGSDVRIRGDALNLNFHGTLGDVSLYGESGTVVVNSGLVADTLNVEAHGDIMLDDAAFIVSKVGSVTGLTSATGNISLREDDGFTIDGDISAAAGNVTLKSDGAIETYSGTLSLGGTLAVTAGGDVSLAGSGAIKLGAVDTTPGNGGGFYLGTDGDIDLTGAVNTGAKNLTLESTAGAITSHGGTVSTQYNGISGIITASANGGIDLTSVGSAVFWTTSTGGGDIKLSGDNDVGFMVNTTGDLTVSAGGWAGNNSDVIARSVGISAGTSIGLIDQTVNIDVGSYRYLTVTDGFIDVENQRDIKLDGNVIAGGDFGGVRLHSTAGSILQNSGTIDGSYSVELNASGSVLQDAAAKLVVGSYGLTLTAGTDALLRGPNEIGAFQTYSVSRDLTLRNTGTLDLNWISNQAATARNVTLISDTGDVVSLHGNINADKLTVEAVNGAVNLRAAGNTIRSLGAVTAKNTGGSDVYIFTTTGLGLTGDITAGGVEIQSGGTINQTGGGITADRLTVGSNGDLLLGGANDFGTTTSFMYGTGVNVTLRNAGDINFSAWAGHGVGTLTLTSDTGGISQTGAIAATTLNAHAVAGIDLSNSSNNFTTLTGLAATGAGANIRIGDTGGFAIEGNITAPGTVALASTGNITTGTTTVGVVTTPHGKVDADTLTVSATNATVYTAGDIKLGTSSVSSGFTLIADGSIDFAATSNFNLASLIATSGSITQSGGILTGNTVLTGAGGGITLDKANILADFGGTSTGGGTVTFNNVRTSALSLSLNTTGNAVVTAAGDVLGSFINVGDLSLTAGAIDLRTNVNVSSFSKLIAAYGDVLVTNTGSFSVTGDVTANTAGLRSVNLQSSGGGISQTGGTISANDVTLGGLIGFGNLTQSGTARVVTNVISLSGFNVLLGGANSFTSGHVTVGANLTLRNAGAIDLDALGGYTSGGTLSLTSDNGSITSANAVSTFFLKALAANGGVSFDNASNSIVAIGGLRALTNATIRTSGALVLNGDLSVGSMLQLYAGTGISQATDTITAGQLDARVSGVGSIALGGANDVDAIYALDALGNVSFRDVDGFDIQGNVLGDHVTLTTDAGAIFERSGSQLIANHLTASAVDGLQLSQIGNSIQYIDGLSLTGAAGGSIGIASNGGDLHLAGNVAAAGQYVYFYVGGGSFIQDSGTIAAGNLAFNVQGGSVTLGANDIASLGNMSIGGDFISTADLSTGVLGVDGNIVANGTITIRNSAGILEGSGGAFNANTLNLITAGTLTADSFANAVNNANIQMDSGSFRNYGDFRLQLAATGAASISSGGNITFDGSASSTADTLTLSAATGIFSAAGVGGKIAVSHLGDVTSTSGGIALNLLGSVTLEGDVTSVGQTVSLTAADGISQAAGSVITANRLNLTTTGLNAAIVLDNANAVSTLGVSATGDASFRNGGDLIVDGINVSGRDITLVSNTGSVTGGAIFAGTLRAGAATGIDLYGPVLILRGLASTAGGVTFTNGNSSVDIDGDINSGTGVTTLNASGGIYQTSGIITAGALSLNASDDVDLMRQNQVGGLSAVNTGGGYFHFANVGDIVIGGGWNVGGDIALTSGGAISQTSAVGASMFSASAVNGIRLDYGSNEIAALGTLSNSGTGGIYLSDNASYTLNGDITAAGQAVELLTNGSITQSGGTTITAAQLRAFGYGSVSLTSVTNDVGEIIQLGSVGDIAFTNAGGFSITGNIIANGRQLNLTSVAGGITQASSTISVGNVIAHAAGAITLGQSNNIGSTTASAFTSATGDILFHSTNAILLGAVSTPGLLSLTTDAGGITQTAGISAARLRATTSTTGDILLDQANAIGTVGDVTTNGSFTLNTSGGLTLDGTISAPDLVQLTAGGDITQVGTGAIHSDLLQATSGAGAINGISLLNQNDVAQALLDSNGKDLRFRNTGDFELGNISAAGHIVEMISDGGAVTQLAGTSILAGTFSATGTNVVLDNAGNQISRIGLISTGSDLSLRNTVALQIDEIDAAGHAVTLNNADNITGGNITANKLIIGITGGYVDLSTASHVGSLGGFTGGQLGFVNDGSFTISGAIQNGMYQTFLTSQHGAISMAAGGAVNSGGLTVQAATGIALTGNMSNIYGATSTSGDVSLISSMLLDIQGDISGDTVTLGGLANGGYVGQASGSITANLLNASGNAYVDLSGATNHIAALGTLNSNDYIRVSSLDAVTLTGNIDSGSIVTLNAGGAVSQTGGRIQAWGLNASAAGDVDLGATNLIVNNGDVILAGDDITFVNDGTFTVAGITAASTGAIDLRSINGSILQNGAMSGGSLTASAQGALTLGQANAVGTVGALSAGTELTYGSAVAYDLTDDIIAGTTVTLNGPSSINQRGGSISAGMLNLSAGSADLQQANAVAQLGTVTTASDFVFRNTGDIELWGTVNVGARFGLHSDTGGVSNPGGLFATDILDVTAAGAINLNGGTLNYLDKLTSQNGDIMLITNSHIFGGSLIAAEDGRVDLFVGGITADAVRTNLLSIDATGADVELLGDNQVAHLGNILADNISLAVGDTDITGWLHGANSIAFVRSGIASDFALTMGAGGAITTNMISLGNSGTAGTATLSNITTGSGTLELNLNFNGDASVTANTSAISLNNATVVGDLSLHAGHAITNTGAGTSISGTLNASNFADDISLLFGEDAVGHFGTFAAGGNVKLGAAAMDITGNIQALGGAVELHSGWGNISQFGMIGIDATTVSGSASRGGFLLAGANNNFTSVGAIASDGDITLHSTNSMTVRGSLSSGGMLALLSGGGVTVDAGNGYTLSAMMFSASATGAVDLTGATNRFGSLVTVTADSLTLANQGDLDLEGYVNADTVNLQSTGQITQSAGFVTADTLDISASNGIALDRQNRVGTLRASNGNGAIRFNNARDLVIDGALSNNGGISLDVSGDLTAAGGIFANGALLLTANGIQAGAATGDEGVTVVSGAHDLNLGHVSSGDDVWVAGGGNVTVASLDMTGLNDAAGDGFNALLSGGNVTLGVGSGPITGASYVNFDGMATPGSVSIQATGNATVRIDDTNMAIGIAATGDVNAESSNQLLLGNVSGANVTLLAGTILTANSVTVRDIYSVTAADIGAGAFNLDTTNGNPLDILIADTAGDLALTGNLVARRNTIVSAAGNVLGSTARLGAGQTMDGTLTVNGGAIALLEASGLYDVTLNGTGALDIGTVRVGRDYTLKGSSFAGNALAPIGTQTGSWSLTGLSDLDLGGATIQYDGGIDFHVTGMLSNGSIRSLTGAVTGSAGVIDLYALRAATDIDATSTAGAFHISDASAGTGYATLRGHMSLTVDGSVEAAGDVGLSAQYGPTTIGHASAGGNISIFSLFGNAILRQASLTGTTGNLNAQSVTGTATLGADDYASIGSDHYFERAAGSTGTASIVGAGHANVYLDHSAALDLIQANTVWVEAQHGDLAIDTLAASAGDATAITGAGSLFVNAARGVGLLLTASGGNLTLGGAGITADGITLVADGTLDTTAVGNLSGQALDLVGGTIRAASLTATGDAQLSSTTGGITMNNLTVGGEVFVSALGNLVMNQVSVGDFSNFVADGDLTVRSVTAHNGFWLTGQGNVTLGADAGMPATSDNYVAVGGTLGNCGCATGGATILSLGGNVSVNLLGATGVFDGVRADLGNVSLSIGSGDLGIGLLKGRDITASTPGVLTVMNAESSGGSYSLTAADFGGFALTPVLFGGATSLGDVTIIDTDGDLNSGGALTSWGNIRVEAQGGAITGGLSLGASGDVTAIGQGVALQQVTGRDVTIDAGTGAIALSGTLNVGRDYTLTGGDFSGSTLWPSGGAGGSLTITDTVGDFAFGGNDLAAGGAISISALHGLLSIGNLQAGDAVTLTAGTDLSLVSAKLTGTGGTAFSLDAGGDLRFGAADAASIVSGNVFSHAGQAPTGTSIRAGGSVTMNLYQADGLGAIDGGTVRIVVAAGDFSAGDIDAVGSLSVQGPSGRLALGDLTTSGGHIDVSGQGNTILGDVTGPSVVNLGASAGNLDVGSVTGGDVSFLVAGGINAASVSADTLGVVAVNGNVDLDHGGAGSNVARLGTVTVNNGDFSLRNLQGLGLDGIVEVNGTLDLQLAGALAQNAYYIVADRLQGSATGAVALAGDNRIATLGSWRSNGFRFSNTTALTIDDTVDAGSGAAVIASHGGLEIGIGGNIVSSAMGDAITLASDGLFTNRAGAGALGTPNGRWLVYTQTGGTPGVSDPNNDFGGLAGTSYYGDAYDFGTGSFATAPNPGNRFVYGYRPVLTVTPSSLHLVYDGTTPVVTATVTGMVNGDTGPNVWSGAADITGVGPNAGTYFAYSTLGTLTSEMGYRFTFVPGTVVIDPRVISAILTANDRSYDGTLGATGTLGLSGVIAGDTVSVNGTGMAFADRNAGTHLVTASGITLSGADAGNYVLAATSVTDLAAILAKAITATLSANGKTYDGTTAATGSLSLDGLIGADQVSANGSYAFDNRSAGTRTVTASGIALSGADAGNYVLTGTSATAVADILARAISATLSANGKTYDGSTAATGSLSLGGLVGNDQVSADGSYAFDSRNAGTRTVTASGITLSGADAGNYVLTGTSATALADILARAISATLTANDRSYDGTTAATGTLGLSGVVAGDAVSASGAAMVFDGRNAGIGRTVTASGISLSGADAGNYVLTGTTATDLADILAKAITATLSVNGRVYDGTAAATGTLGLNGVVAGDQVGAIAGGIAFDSRNAGTRTATASGLALNGDDAGNYTISGTASGNAVISPKAITATATANSRVYDGTTAATGRVALTGLISGDTVTGTASYRFADANAGTGRTVQVSGLALSGADAANYTVTLSATPVTADITRRAVTVTVKDLTKILGQPDPAFAYAVTGGSVVSGDSFSGALVRAAGEQAGRYAIGQGTLALSSNYLLTVVPGTLAITLTQSGAEASDALKTLQVGVSPGFSLDQNLSRNLEGDDQGEDGDDGDK